jgi:hypothetical protein
MLPAWETVPVRVRPMIDKMMDFFIIRILVCEVVSVYRFLKALRFDFIHFLGPCKATIFVLPIPISGKSCRQGLIATTPRTRRTGLRVRLRLLWETTKDTKDTKPSTINLQLFSTANQRECNGRWSRDECREHANHETHERHEKQSRRKEAQRTLRNVRRLTTAATVGKTPTKPDDLSLFAAEEEQHSQAQATQDKGRGFGNINE